MIYVPKEFDGDNAFDGLPMGDWLKKIQEENDLKVGFYSEGKFEEECCKDPEICVYAACATCPECGGVKTIRTTEPDEDNMSEFECLECKDFFQAKNP